METFMYFFPNVWTQFLPRTQSSIYQAQAKIKETNTLYKIIINAYGLKFEDISLELTGTTLELKSSTPSSDLPEEAKLIWQEFNLPKLDHRFKLPPNADIDEISADLNDGILKIKIPKRLAEKKTIELNK